MIWLQLANAGPFKLIFKKAQYSQFRRYVSVENKLQKCGLKQGGTNLLSNVNSPTFKLTTAGMGRVRRTTREFIDDKLKVMIPLWLNPCKNQKNTYAELFQLFRWTSSRKILLAMKESRAIAIQTEDKLSDYSRFVIDVDWTVDTGYFPTREQCPELKAPKVTPKMCAHLMALNYQQALADSYYWIQKFHVALEQVLWDQYNYRVVKDNPNAHELQKKCEKNLTLNREVLCTIWTVIHKLKLYETTPMILKPDILRRPLYPSDQYGQYKPLDNDKYRKHSNMAPKELIKQDQDIYKRYIAYLTYIYAVLKYITPRNGFYNDIEAPIERD